MTDHRHPDKHLPSFEPPQSWMDDALCADVGPDYFHPDSPSSSGDGAIAARAKAVCANCTVIDACLTWALEIEDHHAILGGTTPAERRLMKRRTA